MTGRHMKVDVRVEARHIPKMLGLKYFTSPFIDVRLDPLPPSAAPGTEVEVTVIGGHEVSELLVRQACDRADIGILAIRSRPW